MSVRKTLIYQGFQHIWVKNPLNENEVFLLRGNKSTRVFFDSQVVRFDVKKKKKKIKEAEYEDSE